jgi:RecJ-like exonuclease
MKKLLSLALIFSLVGLFSLLLIAEYLEVEQVSIAELEQRIGQRVSISGEIVKVTQKPAVNFFELADATGRLSVVAFGEMTEVNTNTKVSVSGKVELYKGELEVIADQICLA